MAKRKSNGEQKALTFEQWLESENREPSDRLRIDLKAAFEAGGESQRIEELEKQLATPAPAVAKHGDWKINISTGRPILTYRDCSVIEDEQAEYVLSLIQSVSAALAQPVSQSYKLPDGFKLMPIEMTDGIGEAIAMEARCCGGIALDIYEAALAASPEGGVA
jgi:hypothetical protein